MLSKQRKVGVALSLRLWLAATPAATDASSAADAYARQGRHLLLLLLLLLLHRRRCVGDDGCERNASSSATSGLRDPTSSPVGPARPRLTVRWH